MSIVVDIGRDFNNGVTTVRLGGELTFVTAPSVRTALAKTASECPTAVIVNVAALDVANPSLLVVFAAASLRATAQWGVPLLLCGARPDVRRRISVFRTFTEIYHDPGSAMEAVRDWVPRWRHQRFLPVPASAAQARRLVAQACTEWDLASLRDSATLIVSELASNAIEHAGTAFEVTVSYTTNYLRIAVQDSGPALQRWIPNSVTDATREGGRGLYIVNAVATGWNITNTAGGKFVWALLRARPLDSAHGTDDSAAEQALRQ